MSGTDAFAAKLVNQLGYIEDAYEKAGEFPERQGRALSATSAP